MEKQRNIPHLRFPEFEGEWVRLRFGDISEIIMGQSPDSKSYNFEGEGEFLIQGNADIFERKSNPRQWTNEPTKRCQIGDILFTVRAPVGYVAKSVHNACIGRGVCSVRNTANSEQNFLYQFLLSYELKWKRIEQGSTFTAVSGADIKKIEIKIPLLPEQQKIASFFTVIDEKITQLKQKKTLLELYKKGVMQKIFAQEIRFKDDNGQELPEWKTKVLGDIVVFRNGKGHEQDISENGEYIVVNSKFIASEGEVKKYTDKQICPLYYGEIVMVMSDVPNGKALAKCYFIEKDDKYTLNQRICALKTIVIEPRFLFYILNRNKYYLMFDSGVGQTNLAKDEVLDCPLTIPISNIEQTKIANFLSAIDEKIKHTQKQINKAEVWKKGLMQQMFV